jgi:hypothetical protein
MFDKFILELKSNLYESLLKSVNLEDITKGRKGANLVDYKNGLIPLVRTTTSYKKPNQKFSDVHYNIIDNIKKVTKIKNLEFNNALIELYSDEYFKMGYHSDQALDLAEKSYICIFSCYNDAKTKNLRTLRIKNKLENKHIDILLEHDSIVLFSVDTNKKNLHKIILESFAKSDTLWLGVTFRLSKTYVYFHNELPYFSSNKKELLLASKEQQKEFYKCRSLENSNIEYVYPEIEYTISEGDLLKLK